MKVDKIEKDGRYLKVYKKMKWYETYSRYNDEFNYYFGENKEKYLGTHIDITGKYMVATFVLRDKEDILPYLKVGENDE